MILILCIISNRFETWIPCHTASRGAFCFPSTSRRGLWHYRSTPYSPHFLIGFHFYFIVLRDFWSFSWLKTTPPTINIPKSLNTFTISEKYISLFPKYFEAKSTRIQDSRLYSQVFLQFLQSKGMLKNHFSIKYILGIFHNY